MIEQSTKKRMLIYSGSSNSELAKKVANELGTELAEVEKEQFASGEIYIRLADSARGADCFVLQSHSGGINFTIMEQLLIVDALKRASAKRITAVIPYYGYARQDRKPGPRTPITAKLVANLIVKSGADRVLSMDLHAGQIQGFFDIPTDNLFAAPVLTSDIKEKIGSNNPMIVSPDVGGVVRARLIASRINSDLAIVDKRREKAGESEVMNIIGDVKDRSCFMVDDIVDSAGTLCNAADALINSGAKEVYAHVTHGVLSGEATKRVNDSALTKLVVTDTIQETVDVEKSNKIETISVVHLLGEAIKRISEERSVSSLFD